MVMPEGERVPVVVDADQAARTLDARYLGLTFDTAQMQHRVDGSDLEGGTDADGVYFCDTEEPCEVPQRFLDAYKDGRESHASYFTRKDIREFADFAAAIDAEIIYCLNFGPRPRDPETDAWTDDNARSLIRYARSLPNGDRWASTTASLTRTPTRPGPRSSH
jgi:hypothetical protein